MAELLVAGVAVADFVFQVDALPLGAEKFRAADAEIVGGGCAANAAVAIARHGGSAHLAARLGDDAIADLILGDLDAEGVHLELCDRAHEGKSSFSSVYVDRSGERQIVNFRGTGLTADPAWIEIAPPIDAVLADNRFPPLTAHAMELAARRGVPGIVDAENSDNFDCLSAASHVAFSAFGLTTLTGEQDLTAGLEIAAARLPGWLCVTNGADGVICLDGGKLDHVPGFAVETRDTLGAGDIWHGVFALRIAEGAAPLDAVRYANAAAAIKCTRFGGRKGCPDRAKTDAFIKERQTCN